MDWTGLKLQLGVHGSLSFLVIDLYASRFELLALHGVAVIQFCYICFGLLLLPLRRNQK